VGYQISTFGPFGAHLARLAVHPNAQQRGVGRALLADLIDKVSAHGLQRITVNTQGKNLVSQALYRKMGFVPSGESYPVFTWRLDGSAG
ncbi:MAG: GNAT family N-acetyltransferase, partial [Anaerolineales bacterium]